ncbi:small glutamine-rich tetratricopeptide repeat-containing protein beta-like [Lycorma delicatula]|uniref:small glutamine-rich tetratricopeptide repeat-containing protein beta-like n=1 Tax=Lycorma delicatula TaxID=130591 RepID=UPI003F515529
MAMGDTKKLVFAIIKFLRSQVESGILPADGCEGLEVSIQCLESAYNITPGDTSLDVQASLLAIFQNYLVESEKPVSAEDKVKAEKLKNEGNSLMSSQDFADALECYTKAISLDPKNAVFYCNRAAAYSKLNNHEAAIKDCKTALQIDPSYGKAYGRLGLAYSSLNRHQEAWESYRKALDLEPENESYRNNLQLAEDKLNTESNRRSNVDLGMVLTNPALLNMATQMLSNPTMQSMMNNIMSGTLSQNGSTMEQLLQAGQQLAQQMQSENPALIEQLRRQLGNDNPPAQPPGPDGGTDGSS